MRRWAPLQGSLSKMIASGIQSWHKRNLWGGASCNVGSSPATRGFNKAVHAALPPHLSRKNTSCSHKNLERENSPNWSYLEFEAFSPKLLIIFESLLWNCSKEMKNSGADLGKWVRGECREHGQPGSQAPKSVPQRGYAPSISWLITL